APTRLRQARARAAGRDQGPRRRELRAAGRGLARRRSLVGGPMNAPHFGTDPAVAAAVLARMARDPAGAVRAAHARGFRVDETDVNTEFTTQLASLPPKMAGDFRMDHAAELQNERTAVMLARNSQSILSARGDAAAVQHATER